MKIVFIVVTVTERGTESFQRMLQEDMHEVAGMNTQGLKQSGTYAINSGRTSYSQLKGCYVVGD